MRGSCPMRIIPCTLNCGLKIRFTDLPMHLENECTRRFTINNSINSNSNKRSSNSSSKSTRETKSLKDNNEVEK